MSRSFVFAALLLSLAAGTGTAQKKTTLALIDLEISKDLSQDISVVLSNLIRQEFVQSEDYEILDRNNMESILKEQDFVMSDVCAAKECAVQVGQLLGVEKILFGTVGSLGKKMLITLQMVDVTSGKIDRIENETHVGAIEDLDAPIRTVARKIAGLGTKEKRREPYEVVITSEPEGASVYINNELRGTTPANLSFPGEEKIAILIRAQDFQDWFQEIKPKRNERTIVTARLLAGKSGVLAKGTEETREDLKLRFELYDLKKKTAGRAFLISFYAGMFGGGHFYAKSYLRGGIICAAGLVGYATLVSNAKSGENVGVPVVLILGAWGFDLIGAQSAVRKYNENLKKELKISVSPSIVPGGAGLAAYVRF